MFDGYGPVLAVVENTKTAIQLKKTAAFPKTLSDVNLPNLLNGSLTSYVRSVAVLGCRIFTNIHVDNRIERDTNYTLPFALQGVAGVVVGTVITYPLELVRARQGATTFAPVLSADDKRVTVKSVFETTEPILLYRGLGIALVHSVAEYMLTKVTSHSLLPIVSKHLIVRDATLASRFCWFLGLSFARILLNPLEIVKKTFQVSKAHSAKDLEEKSYIEALRDLYNAEGIEGLYRGALLSIPEAFCAVILTHLGYNLTVRVLGE